MEKRYFCLRPARRTTQLAANTFSAGAAGVSHAAFVPRRHRLTPLALRNKDNFNSFHTKYLINMTFKNILPDQHLILKFVTQSKKKKKCCQDLKGLTSEIKTHLSLRAFFSCLKTCAQKQPIVAEPGRLFHPIPQCSHYSSIRAPAWEFC